MDESAARALAEQLGQIEDRLGRLLASGWRHAGAEAATLRADADALAEAGLASVAERIGAVAGATTAAEALERITLASSACRLVRARLPVDAPPDGWHAVGPARDASRAGRSRKQPDESTVMPLARLQLEGEVVWVCIESYGRRWLLLDPPALALNEPWAAGVTVGDRSAGNITGDVEGEADGASDRPVQGGGGGLFGRFRHRVQAALGMAVTSGSPWLHRRLRGRLVWRATYPFGADGEVVRYALEGERWQPDADAEADTTRPFRSELVAGRPVEDLPLFRNARAARLKALDRDRADAYTWLDRSTRTAFLDAASGPSWALAWVEGETIVPLALLAPGGIGRVARLVHLIPGTPADVLSS